MVFLRRALRIYISSFVAIAIFGVAQYVYEEVIGPTYWSQYGFNEWLQGATLFGYFTGVGDKINGTTWFLLPLFYFYILSQIMLWIRSKKGWSFTLNVLQAFGIIAPILIKVLYWHEIFRTSYYFEFVYIPISGLIAYALLMEKEGHFWSGAARLIVNYINMVLAFYFLNNNYYSNEPYIASVIYAFSMFLFFYYNEKNFKDNKVVSFIVSISFPVYLLQQTWGSWIMSMTGESQHFTLSLVIGLAVVIVLSVLHNDLIDKVLKKILRA